MPDDAAGIQLTVLDTAESVDESRLPPTLYAYPDDLRSCWVRGNMIASLDGGATADGKSGGLGGPGDRAVFSLMRQAADVILVGAATVRIENYSGAQLPSPRGRPASAADRPRCRRSPSSPGPATSTATPWCSPAPRCRR